MYDFKVSSSLLGLLYHMMTQKLLLNMMHEDKYIRVLPNSYRDKKQGIMFP